MPNLVPTIWLYFYRTFFKVFIVIFCTLVALLFTLRIDELAQYISFGPPLGSIVLFALCLLTFYMPMALPVATIFSSYLLYQNLTARNELTALRASGISLKQLLHPIFLASIVLSAANFTAITELRPMAQRQVFYLAQQLSEINPIQLARQERLMRRFGMWADWPVTSADKPVDELFLAIDRPQQNSMYVLFGKDVVLEGHTLKASSMTHIFSGRDGTAIIENSQDISADSGMITNLITMAKPAMRPEDHNFINLWAERDNPNMLTVAMNRMLFGCMPLIFFLLGSSAGITVGRSVSPLRLVGMSLCAGSVLLGATMMMQKPGQVLTCSLLAIIPVALSVAYSLFLLRRTSRGFSS